MQKQSPNFFKSYRIFSVVFKYITIIVLSSCLLLFPYSIQASNLYSIDKVVIDPGHGGKDPGCLGVFTNEKTIALGIALKLGKYIKENFNDIEVIYTRKRDDFVESHKRTSLANDNEADLFISIHTNAGPRTAYGTESYVLGLPETDANIAVSERENLPILLEENYHEKYNGFNPNLSKASINPQFYQNPFLYQSSLLASKIQKQFKNTLHRRDRGVRQAGFVVLYKTKMPSILIEVGFLTNPCEEKFLSSAKGQYYLASAIFRGFKEYKIEMETQKRKELEARLVTDYTSKEKALQQVNAANAKVDAARETVTLLQAKLETECKKNERVMAMVESEALKRKELEAKLTTDYMSKEKALQHINAANAKAYAARETITILQATLKTACKKNEQVMAMVESEALKRKELEAKLATDYMSKEKALQQVNAANSKADATSKTVTIVQAKLETACKKNERVMAMVESEALKRKELEAKLATDYMSKEKALQHIADVTSKTGTILQATLKTELKKNEQMIKHLNETIKKAENKDRTIVALRTKVEEDHKSKKDVSVQKESNTGVSGIGKKNKKVGNTDSSAKIRGIIFKIQILMSKTSLKRNSPRFKGIKNVWEYKHGGLYKYTTGNKKDLKSAIALQSKLRKKGFGDAFVVTFQNGKRTPMKVVLDVDKMQYNSKT